MLSTTGCATGGGTRGDVYGLTGTSSWAQWRAHELRAGYLQPQSRWHLSSFQGLVDYRYLSTPYSAVLMEGRPEAIYARAQDWRDRPPIDPQTGLQYGAKDGSNVTVYVAPH
ncbi:hypothetical protein FGE12_14870 [Aggregicoccus sp. 17bor-14]|uniref:hypothetical protein n=1 Tax=Myxococcaceae TaxID=31 RepID=UPI00129CA503|nr:MULTISPECIES: hypothetical protein [Myxococcaceae]MBF5043676.1 hypothetical protein [Simulacricoccus sp. 17bor-14]MRI89434.1 hypothetical protein [Aggregicoccus sp. 17bor-14]